MPSSHHTSGLWSFLLPRCASLLWGPTSVSFPRIRSFSTTPSATTSCTVALRPAGRRWRGPPWLPTYTAGSWSCHRVRLGCVSMEAGASEAELQPEQNNNQSSPEVNVFQQDTTQTSASEAWSWAAGRSRGWRSLELSWKNLGSFCWMRWGCTQDYITGTSRLHTCALATLSWFYFPTWSELRNTY